MVLLKKKKKRKKEKVKHNINNKKSLWFTEQFQLQNNSSQSEFCKSYTLKVNRQSTTLYKPNIKQSMSNSTWHKKRHHPAIHTHIKTAILWAHAPAPFSPIGAFEGRWGVICHFHPQSTSTYSKEHTQQPSSQRGLLLRGPAQGLTWLTPRGRRVGTVSGLISLISREMVGNQCPLRQTHIPESSGQYRA